MESNSKNVTYVYDTVVLSDGRILDLARSDQGNLKVIVHNENRNEVYDQVWYGNTYQPASLDPDVRGAVRFPDSAKPYENAATLLAKLSQLCAKQYGLSPLSASVVAVWLLTTWMSEAFTAPPTLLVNASCTGDVMRFFKLLQALCRRGLIVNELSFHLPLFLAPTLLVLEPGLSEKMRARWFLSAYRGVFVPKANGGLRQVVCSKAVHSGVTQSGTSWGDETLEVSLLPSHAFPKASKSELDAIAAEFQPKMQLLRFHYLERKPAASNGKVPSELAGSVLATELFSLLGNDSTKYLLPVAEQHRKATFDRISTDPLAVIIEAIWAPAHEGTSLGIAEVTKRVNALLQARGEALEYGTREVGWKISQLDLPRHRTAPGMVLQFSREHRTRIHDHAFRFGLQLPKIDTCDLCETAKSCGSKLSL